MMLEYLEKYLLDENNDNNNKILVKNNIVMTCFIIIISGPVFDKDRALHFIIFGKKT